MSLSNPWVLPMLATGVVLVAATVRASRSRSYVQEHMLVAVCCAFYTIPYAAELASTSLLAKLLWHRVAWIGISTMPASAILLALRFVGRPLSRRGATAVWFLAFVFCTLSATNELHYWLESPATLTSYGSFAMRNQAGRGAFWLFTGLAYLGVLGSLVCYAAVWLTGSTVFQRQGRLLFIGTSIPLFGNILYLFLGGTSIRELDPTPLLFGITCMVYAYSLRSGLLQIVPVARHAMFDEMEDAVFVLDRHDRVIDANPAALGLVGRAGSNHQPTTSLRTFLHGAPSVQGLLAANALGELGDARVGERSFAVRATSLSAGDGRLVFLRDMTARAEQAEAQRVALDAAARAKRAQGDFIARMSHELRTPLHGVMGSTEMLLSTLATDDARRRFAEASMLSARVLLDLVDDVLDFERLERETRPPTTSPFDTNALWKEVAAAQVYAAERKGLSLVCDGASTPCWVLGDRHRLRQILTNLVGNAIKFSKAGTVTITASVEQHDGSAALRVDIDDEGPGIPSVELERVFDPFVQLQDGITRENGGAGLGLAICRQLAHGLGARVELHNRPHGGLRASLSCELPRCSAPVPAPLVSSPALGGAHVFVADDNPVSRDVVGWLLGLVGANYTVFSSGAELVRAALQAPPDLALVDLHMPDGGGREVAATLRSAGLVSLPIVAFTADGREAIRAECLAAGMNDLLQKPCTVAELRACLQRHLADALGPFESFVDRKREAELRALFLRTIPGEWARLADAFAHGNREEVRRLAHEMAGAAALTGFAPVVESCQQLLEVSEFDERHVDAVRAVCLSLAETGEARELAGL